jgi:predicted short-subunit dehydrogenase-like oxidoreductase (DUF2520 family)
MDVLDDRSLTIVGAGRMGTALAAALTQNAVKVTGPLRRGEPVTGDLVLLAVPDREIGNALALVPADAIVGHCAGALTLDVFGGRESFSVHPLMTVTLDRTVFADAWAAVAGSTPRALEIARAIVARLGMHAIEVPDAHRVAYHAAASIAANYLITIESIALKIGAAAGLKQKHLLPLARAALENWGERGPNALTGPIARGDDETIARHRAVIAEIEPKMLPVWEAMTEATRKIVSVRYRPPVPGDETR